MNDYIKGVEKLYSVISQAHDDPYFFILVFDFFFQREEVLGKSTFELNTWAENERRDMVHQLSQKDYIRSLESEYQTKMGKTGHINSEISILELNGEKYGFCIAVDITERKKSEAALHLSKKVL